MDQLLSTFKITIPEGVFIKDPETSVLGKNIITQGMELIHEMGFDGFTFKKLGTHIGSNESSIYRYFENKHKFLLYLSSWYWAWVEYNLVMETHSITDPKEKIIQAVTVLTRKVDNDSSNTPINLVLIHKIMISEFSKSFLTKSVDQENEQGLFVAYKRVHSRLQGFIKVANPSYNFSASLANTILAGVLQQYYYKDHFPSLTDCSDINEPCNYYINLIYKTLY
ncbi:MAG: TetR/AcrR family transcriptional regulator [Flavobacteriaceae bacterium]|jgi:AcrR family transcriptional regulator|uniref:TetR/AcrR family transcriptional regulator n=1 Tax=Flavobacterium sp. TaxID=239 RepID=UPI002335AAC9|nr:TetR/AcrR family transcriptional regulator [Flavobacteriaceae bacterium]MBT5393868.1 TetR/AcrR family transcriptional regulator [Flavobacteriaceae bacterium]MBT5584746.1 TetR/AcrR family transcriptional regulator [Flavobacteriaceae bacterium]MDB4329416.1 TetR/AcrR family transcriptional regulator [Flavobacteriaceae bacterium]MDG1047720.1 TetR/AcrR family transcriptional regulator [Flavobacteriaceae bacterium]|tara:strand:+ start:4677 stop:5348 length:672 start_codon:yes stop_codon:yes gene_type:complete